MQKPWLKWEGRGDSDLTISQLERSDNPFACFARKTGGVSRAKLDKLNFSHIISAGGQKGVFNKMNFNEIYGILERNKYYVFSFEDLLLFCPVEKKENLKKSIYRWKNKGWIYSLKRGLYELTYPEDFTIPDLYIANRLYHPSYVSLETALSNYSIIPEISMAVTSITTKPTRRFKNKHGLFIYHTIKPEVFTGYYVEKHRTFEFLIAEPEKAFIDYLYFKVLRNKKFRIQDERFDNDAISQLNKKKLKKYAKLYNINLKEIYAHL